MAGGDGFGAVEPPCSYVDSDTAKNGTLLPVNQVLHRRRYQPGARSVKRRGSLDTERTLWDK